jgi:glycosyltransferase involved in cell wall biosynthesis
VHQTGRGADTPFNQSVWYYEFSSKVIGYFVYLLEPLLLRSYRAIDIIVPSESTRNDLKKLGINAKNIEVAEPGITINRDFRINKSQTPTIIYLGRVNRYKRVEDVIRTFAIVNKHVPASRLIVAGLGDRDYIDYLSTVARQTGISEKIDFLGKVSEHDKLLLLGQAHLMLFPSVREGWGISVIEANSMGTPVIGYNVPGLQDSIMNGRTGALVELGDIEAMANASITLLKDKSEKWMAYSKEAMDWASKFSWDRAAETFALIIARHLEK